MVSIHRRPFFAGGILVVINTGRRKWSPVRRPDSTPRGFSVTIRSLCSCKTRLS